MARVFVDTNVLFPFSIMDMMLSLAEDFVHDFMWSDRLLDEWQRVIVREPDEVLTTLQRMAAGKRRPPMTVTDVIDALHRAGVPAFAHRARGLFADRRKRC